MNEIEFESIFKNKVSETSPRKIGLHDLEKSIGPLVHIENGKENKYTLYITAYFHKSVEASDIVVPTFVDVVENEVKFTIESKKQIKKPDNCRFHWEIILEPKATSRDTFKNLKEIEVTIDFKENHSNNSGDVGEPKRATRVIPPSVNEKAV
jgi:hypothetical protein